MHLFQHKINQIRLKEKKKRWPEFVDSLIVMHRLCCTLILLTELAYILKTAVQPKTNETKKKKKEKIPQKNVKKKNYK